MFYRCDDDISHTSHTHHIACSVICALTFLPNRWSPGPFFFRTLDRNSTMPCSTVRITERRKAMTESDLCGIHPPSGDTTTSSGTQRVLPHVALTPVVTVCLTPASSSQTKSPQTREHVHPNGCLRGFYHLRRI